MNIIQKYREDREKKLRYHFRYLTPEDDVQEVEWFHSATIDGLLALLREEVGKMYIKGDHAGSAALDCILNLIDIKK